MHIMYIAHLLLGYRGLDQGCGGSHRKQAFSKPERVGGEATWSLCFSSWENHGLCQLLPVALRKSRQQHNQWHICKSRVKVGKGKERRKIMSYCSSMFPQPIWPLQSFRPWVITHPRKAGFHGFS